MGLDKLDQRQGPPDPREQQLAEERYDFPGRLALAARQGDYWATVYRRTWRGSVITSFVMPLFYVVAMGVLLGGFIDSDPAELEGARNYLAFVAPGLLASQAMMVVISEVTWPVMGMIKWNRIAYGMTATPLTAVDVVNAHLGFLVFRLSTVSVVFIAVMAPFGVYETWWGPVLAFPVAVLTGLALGMPVYGVSAGLKTEEGFALIYRLGVMPMFLFSGAFFPVTNLSPALEAIAKVTPLWHGVDLTRMLTLDTLDADAALLHLAYLGALFVVGWWWACRRLTARLVDG